MKKQILLASLLFTFIVFFKPCLADITIKNAILDKNFKVVVHRIKIPEAAKENKAGILGGPGSYPIQTFKPYFLTPTDPVVVPFENEDGKIYRFWFFDAYQEFHDEITDLPNSHIAMLNGPKEDNKTFSIKFAFEEEKTTAD